MSRLLNRSPQNRSPATYSFEDLYCRFEFSAWYPDENTTVQFSVSRSEGSKGITHYLGNKNRFDVSSKGPSSGISVGGSGKARVFLYK